MSVNIQPKMEQKINTSHPLVAREAQGPPGKRTIGPFDKRPESPFNKQPKSPAMRLLETVPLRNCNIVSHKDDRTRINCHGTFGAPMAASKRNVGRLDKQPESIAMKLLETVSLRKCRITSHRDDRTTIECHGTFGAPKTPSKRNVETSILPPVPANEELGEQLQKREAWCQHEWNRERDECKAWAAGGEKGSSWNHQGPSKKRDVEGLSQHEQIPFSEQIPASSNVHNGLDMPSTVQQIFDQVADNNPLQHHDQHQQEVVVVSSGTDNDQLPLIGKVEVANPQSAKEGISGWIVLGLVVAALVVALFFIAAVIWCCKRAMYAKKTANDEAQQELQELRAAHQSRIANKDHDMV